jgi:hypothetical protein
MFLDPHDIENSRDFVIAEIVIPMSLAETKMFNFLKTPEHFET